MVCAIAFILPCRTECENLALLTMQVFYHTQYQENCQKTYTEFHLGTKSTLDKTYIIVMSCAWHVIILFIMKLNYDWRSACSYNNMVLSFLWISVCILVTSLLVNVCSPHAPPVAVVIEMKGIIIFTQVWQINSPEHDHHIMYISTTSFPWANMVRKILS